MVQHPRLAVTRPTYIATDAVPFPEISIQLFPIGVNKKGAVRTLARRQKAGTNPPTVGRHATNISSEGASTFHTSIPQTASESYPFPLDTKKKNPLVTTSDASVSTGPAHNAQSVPPSGSSGTIISKDGREVKPLPSL